VPALPSGERQTLCCPRCGQAVCADMGGPDSSPIGVPQAQEGFRENRRASRGSAAPIDQLWGLPPNLGDDASGPFDFIEPPPAYDSWELDEELQHIGRILHGGKTSKNEAARFDPPQASPPAGHVQTRHEPAKQRKAARARGSASNFFTWFVLTLGTTSFACGAILLGWSLATERQELWSVGVPVALAGQIALLIGLVLQIDRLWHDNRKAAAKIDNVDQQIHDLKTTTMLLSAGQGPASATFYSHLAGGAGPQLLLTDLKSQLDLLAIKIAQESK
jgi:hypothetical protein